MRGESDIVGAKLARFVVLVNGQRAIEFAMPIDVASCTTQSRNVVLEHAQADIAAAADALALEASLVAVITD